MSARVNPSRNGKLQIIMNQSFSDFDKNKKKRFEKDLGKEIEKGNKNNKKKKIPKDPKYKRGCVIFEGELDLTCIDNILINYSDYKDNPISGKHNSLAQFIKKYSITNIAKFEKVNIEILVRNKYKNIRSFFSPENHVFNMKEHSIKKPEKLYQIIRKKNYHNQNFTILNMMNLKLFTFKFLNSFSNYLIKY